MKKMIFIVWAVCNTSFAVAQNDSLSSSAVKEVAKLDVLTQLTEGQHAEILKILQNYYKHKEDLVEAKEKIVKAKEDLRNLLDLVQGEESSFDDRLKYILTQHQYEKSIPYFKARKAKINKANGVPKARLKISPKATTAQGTPGAKLKILPKKLKVQGS
jgi:hypothetical protein